MPELTPEVQMALMAKDVARIMDVMVEQKNDFKDLKKTVTDDIKVLTVAVNAYQVFQAKFDALAKEVAEVKSERKWLWTTVGGMVLKFVYDVVTKGGVNL